MSWKKNAVSYVTWFIYTVITGLALLALGTEICGRAGLSEYMGIGLALGYTAAAGGLAFLLHRFAAGRVSLFEEKRIHFTVLGTLLAVALFAVGFFLRLQGIGGAEYGSSIYYETAKVTEDQGIPESVHGAVYFYVRLLRGVFLLLGNNAVMGVWLQILLQLAASLFLFLAVRRLAGMTAGLVVLGFCMCGPYMVRSSLELSPRMLYFFLVTAVLWYMSAGYGEGDDEPHRLSHVSGFLAGVLAAVCGYLDILGFALLFVAVGRIFCRGVDGGAKRKAAGVLLCAAGAILGFGLCVCLDAWLSRKAVHRVAGAWLSLYVSEGFALPAEAGGLFVENCLLFGCMAFGIFSFWFDRERERISAAMFTVCGVMAAGCLGILTEELPAFFSLYLTCAALAGVGMGQCLHVSPAKERETAQEENPDFEILMEGMPEEKPRVQFLENPLPLPKKHVKRVLDYSLPPAAQDDDFDFPVAEDDDFDI